MKLTKRQLSIICILIVIIVALVLIITRAANHHSSKRQAVFLTNGQVYFGYIKNEGRNTVTLTDVYYLQAQSNNSGSVQPAGDKSEANNSQVSLIKLGNELHAPESVMRINREHILF